MLIYGAGDHGKVVCSVLNRLNVSVEAFFDDNDLPSSIGGVQVQFYSHEFRKDIPLILAIGSNHIRQQLATKVSHQFGTVVDSSVLCEKSTPIGEGSMVLMGVVVNSNATIGKHVILNTGSIIEHDCVIEDFVHVGPGSVLCGRVKVGTLSLIGAGAVILPGVSIGKRCIVGAGSVVTKDLQDGEQVVGNPARKLEN